MNPRLVADIIPIMRLPRGREFFTYSVPTEMQSSLTPGAFVRIPLQAKLLWGCIKTLRPAATHDRKLLPIKEYRPDVPSLLAADFFWLDTIAPRLGISTATALKTFFPAIPVTRYEMPGSFPCPAKIGTRLPAANQRHVEAWLSDPTPISIQYDKRNNKERCLVALAELALARGQNVHVITARIEDADQFVKLFTAAALPVVALHSGLSPRAQWQSWQQAAHCQPIIVVSTKLYLLLPVARPHIIINDEEVDEFKQRDLDPRYDARELVPLISPERRGALLSFTRTPRVERFFLTQQRSNKSFRLRSSSTPAKIHFIHLTTTLDDMPLLSPAFVDHLRAARARQQQVLIIHNRKGGFRLVRCADCGWLYQCATCHLPFEGKIKPGAPRQISCPNCTAAGPARCEQCQSARVKLSSPGVDVIEDAIQHIFPGDRLLTIARENRVAPADMIDYDIILATRAAERSLLLAPPPRLGLIAVTLAEFGLSGHDFSSAEHVFQFLASLALLGNELRCPVIAQAIDPARPIFQALGSGIWEDWFKQELDERKKFSYPPFTDLTLVWYDGTRRDDHEQNINNLILQLKNFPSVLQVLRTSTIRRRNREVPCFLLKTNRGAIDWVSVIPAVWKIDRNPDSINEL